MTGNRGVVPWREAFPEYSDDMMPGGRLAGARYKEGLTQRRLAGLCGIPRRHISEMENGKRTIGRETARKLAAALHAGHRIFL